MNIQKKLFKSEDIVKEKGRLKYDNPLRLNIIKINIEIINSEINAIISYEKA